VGDVWLQFQQVIFSALLYLQQNITHDWGMAIILLTLAIRVLLLPLTWKQTKSMVEMQRIQPQIKALNEKYKDDKEKLQEETLKFYSENKVNPLGGCLPLLLQMPILFALYSVLGPGKPGHPGLMIAHLQNTGEVGKFFQLISNLSMTPKAMWAAGNIPAFIPYILLVLLFAVSIWLPQALMPGDKQQKMIGGYMAIMMLYFGWVSPAGVLLYWDVSSIWGIVQQQITMSITNRQIEQGKDAVVAKAIAVAEEAGISDKVDAKKPSNKSGKKSKKS